MEIFLVKNLLLNIINFDKNDILMFALVLIGLFCIFGYGMGNVAAATENIIYFNASSGHDSWNGQSALWNGISGPKASTKNAIETVNKGGKIYIANGNYSGTNNTSITINKNMTIVAKVRVTP